MWSTSTHASRLIAPKSFSPFCAQNHHLPVHRVCARQHCNCGWRHSERIFSGQHRHRARSNADRLRYRRHQAKCVSVRRRPIPFARAGKAVGHVLLAVLSGHQFGLDVIHTGNADTARLPLFRRVELLFVGVRCAGGANGFLDSYVFLWLIPLFGQPTLVRDKRRFIEVRKLPHRLTQIVSCFSVSVARSPK